MKPAAKRLEVDVPLDTENPNYSKADDDVGSGYKQINKLTLRSQLVEAKSSMAMGTIQDGKLLLAPIDLCLQLRPNLAHLNVSRKGRCMSLMQLCAGSGSTLK
jgi:DNA-directed RNA polymerase-3 subunit RPC5